MVEDSLARGRVAIDVAGNTLVNFVVVDSSVNHGFDSSFEAHLRIVDLPAGLDEFGHAYAEDVDWGGHDGGVYLSEWLEKGWCIRVGV